MKWTKRATSAVLTAALAASMAVPISGTAVAAEGDPWKEDASWPPLTAVSDLEPGTTYFTGNEWTGDLNSQDINGQTVNQSEIYEVNREPLRSADAIPYDSVEAAREGAVDYKPELSGYYQLLTGEGDDQKWDLTVYRSPAEAEADGISDEFYKVDYDTSLNPYTGNDQVATKDTANYACGWKSVTLPASWQTQGFDFPIFINITYPWPGHYGNANDPVPAAPKVFNPVGFYRRSFDVDPAWMEDGKKVYISFQGVESCMYLYVNGHEVGYAEDSFDAKDFDITPFLNEDGKDNVLAVKVIRWCDGSYMEDQDYLRLAGIFREVYLYAAPAVRIRDYKVETDLDENYENADLSLDLYISNESDEAADSYGVDVKLFDAEGKDVLADNPLRGDAPEVASMEEGTLSLNRLIENPHLWSDEDPYLYTLVVSLYEKDSGRYFHSLSQQLGFREIEFTMTQVDENLDKTTTSYQTVTINGQPLKLWGVNRHDVNPDAGRYDTKELYEKDIELMKQFNVNAIRTSHYPNDRYMYYLCDKYGIYVLAEANNESHGLGWDDDTSLGNYFEDTIFDRIAANVNAQKNRTSVVMWSMGNETAGSGPKKVYRRAIQEVIRPLDTTRPVQMERLGWGGGVDIGSTMYSYPNEVEAWGQNADRMPYLMSEYAHAQGNSEGGLNLYMDVFRNSSNLLGGFIWDWIDQSIATPIPAGYDLTADQSQNGFVASLSGSLSDDASAPDGKSFDGVSIISESKNEGANDKINAVLSGNNPFTLELYMQQIDTSRSYNTILAKGDHQVAMRTMDDGNGNVNLVFYVYAGGTWIPNDFRLPADWVGNWHLLTVTFDGTNMVAYCDGEPLTCVTNPQKTVDGAIAASSQELAVGRDVEHAGSGGTDAQRDGNNKYAQVRIYSKALSQEEIKAQLAGDENTGSYAIEADDPSVLLWMDAAEATVQTDDSVWDYYAEIGREDMAGKYFGYGGSWNEEQHDADGSSDGLITSDRTPQPELYEVKYNYQNILMSADEAGILRREVTFRNDYNFTDLSQFKVSWELTEDGKMVDKGTLSDLSLAPRTSGTVSVPFQMPATTKADAEYFLNLSVTLKEDTLWADKDFEIAYQQFRVPATVEHIPGLDVSTIGNAVLKETGDAYTVEGDGFSLTVNKATGLITDYTYDDTVLLTGATPNYWRAKTNNDQNIDGKWETANQNMQLKSLTAAASQDGKSVEIKASLGLNGVGDSTQDLVYTVYGSGEVQITATLHRDAEIGEMLSYGTELTLPRGYENITWYGHGPQETFGDRNLGAPIGVYESTVSDSYFSFARPQDTGRKTGVRFMALEDPQESIGLMVVGEQPIEAAALHFSTAELSNKGHTYQLPKTDHTVMRVDYKSRGTSTSSLGPPPQDEYRLINDGSDLTYTYTIVPYETATADKMELSKVWRDADSFDQAAHDKQQAAAVDALISDISIAVTEYQKDDIEAARAAYEKLTDAQKELVTGLAYLEQAEEEIKTAYGAKAYVTDASTNAAKAEITQTASIVRDETSPTGYAMKGYFDAPNSDLFNNVFTGTSAYTMEVWVNPADMENGNTFLAKGDFQTSLKIANGQLEFALQDGSSWTTLNVNIPAGFVGSWHQLAATYDGSTMAVYMDGQQLGSQTLSTPVHVQTTGNAMGFGHMDGSATNVLRGSMAAARVYSRALTADEILAQYNYMVSGSGRHIDAGDRRVAAWYDFTAENTSAEGGTTWPEDPAVVLEAARAAAQAAVDSFSATNATTADDILAAVEAAVDNDAIAAAWTQEFKKEEATADAAGSITGVITLTYEGASAQVTVSLTIPALSEIIKGDMNGDQKVDIIDVMAACRVLARKNTGNDPLPEEMLRGDMNGDEKFLIDDIMAICRVLASQKQN